ncbi:MAG: hypothetical protein V3T80_08580 [Kiloniellales bacterium]|jgi:hypothetical protein
MEIQTAISEFLTVAVVIMSIGAAIYPLALAYARHADSWPAHRAVDAKHLRHKP